MLQYIPSVSTCLLVHVPQLNACSSLQISSGRTLQGVCKLPFALQVLVDTERDGHRVSFNEAFKQKGIRAAAHSASLIVIVI